MSLKKKLNQYGVLIVGLLIGGGFAFGGIASYAGLVNSGDGPSNSGQEFNETLPQNYFQMESFGLSTQDQRILAYENDVVFVNSFYTTTEEKQQLEELEGVQENFNGRMYFNALNYSETTFFQTYGFTEFPKAVIVGASRSQSQAILVVNDVSRENIAASACEGLRSWNTLASYCSSVEVN